MIGEYVEPEKVHGGMLDRERSCIKSEISRGCRLHSARKLQNKVGD